MMRVTKRKPEANILRLWRQFKAAGRRDLRNRLVENYFSIVKYNAERVAAKLPDEVEVDDLISAGIFGLVDAIESFDPDRGVKFETFCTPRIRGSIFDELRTMDWVPRLVRSRSQKLAKATRALEAEFGRRPTDDELAQRMDVSPPELTKVLRDATTVSLISLSRKFGETDSSRDVREIDILEDKRGADPVAEVQRRDLKRLIVRGLSRAERLVLILYYYEELTMKEIGAVLDLSESRVSQMHSSITHRLKVQLNTRQKELVT